MQWEIHLSPIYGEVNYATDYLANFDHSFTYRLHFFNSPHRNLFH
ncbi:hypothetical protein LINGRAHAP2_LOCUS34155 [Linum grandiflorum]